MSGFEVASNDWQANYEPIGFEGPEEYILKCSPRCPAYQPIHRDLSGEPLIQIEDFDAAKVTDRELRQAVLAVLYKYHARHPERYGYFDVTLEFIAQCLGISILDVVRVVSPMKDEEEIKTLRYSGDAYFKYLTITSKGIKMIDEEPLFDRLDTAGVRVMGDQFNVSANNIQGAFNVGHQNKIDVQQEIEINTTEVVKLLTQFEGLLREEDLPDTQKAQAIKYLNDAKEEAQQKQPNRELMAKKVNQAIEVVKKANEAVGAGKGLVEKLQPILIPLASWLGHYMQSQG